MKTSPTGARSWYDIQGSLVHLTKIQLHGGFNIQISYIKPQYVCTQKILELLFQLVYDTDGHPRDGYQSHLYCIHLPISFTNQFWLLDEYSIRVMNVMKSFSY